MSTTRSGHLTDDQFMDCVIEAPSLESEAHLHDCLLCREELTRFKTSLEDFSRAAIDWSEAQPPVSLRTAVRSQPSQSWSMPVGWALATALLLAVGIPVGLHYERQTATVSDVALANAPDDSEEQIAQDNQLMRSVNMAIRMNDPSLLREYGLQTAPHARLKPISGLRSE